MLVSTVAIATIWLVIVFVVESSSRNRVYYIDCPEFMLNADIGGSSPGNSSNQNCFFEACFGDNLLASGCHLDNPWAFCIGNTSFALIDVETFQVVATGEPVCGTCSRLNYTVPSTILIPFPPTNLNVTIREPMCRLFALRQSCDVSQLVAKQPSTLRSSYQSLAGTSFTNLMCSGVTVIKITTPDVNTPSSSPTEASPSSPSLYPTAIATSSPTTLPTPGLSALGSLSARISTYFSFSANVIPNHETEVHRALVESVGGRVSMPLPNPVPVKGKHTNKAKAPRKPAKPLGSQDVNSGPIPKPPGKPSVSMLFKPTYYYSTQYLPPGGEDKQDLRASDWRIKFPRVSFPFPHAHDNMYPISSPPVNNIKPPGKQAKFGGDFEMLSMNFGFVERFDSQDVSIINGKCTSDAPAKT